jgi:hypothetical protein
MGFWLEGLKEELNSSRGQVWELTGGVRGEEAAAFGWLILAPSND